MLGLNEAVDLLAMANRVCCYGNVLSRALEFEVECKWKKWRQKISWKKYVAVKCMKVGLNREYVLC